MLLDPCKASPCLPILNAIYRFGGTPASQQIIFFLFIKNGKQNLAQLYLQFGALDMALWPSEQIFIKKLVLENGILLAHQFLYSLLHSQINWLSSGPDKEIMLKQSNLALTSQQVVANFFIVCLPPDFVLASRPLTFFFQCLPPFYSGSLILFVHFNDLQTYIMCWQYPPLDGSMLNFFSPCPSKCPALTI